MERYTAILRAAGALDFDDLLLRARRAAQRRDESVRESWQRRFPYVLVDEYQDTNRAQYDLVRLLARTARQPDRGRRRGPVDLLLARRRHPEHPRLRARLPRRARLPPGGELPLPPERARRGGGPRRRTTCRRKGKTLRAVRGGGEPVRAARRPLDEYAEAGWVVERTARLRGAGSGGGPDADERAEPAVRRGPAAGADPLPGRGRRRLLRAQGGEGRPRLPAPAREPARLRRAAPGRQRPAARHRGEDGRGDRPRRRRAPARAPGTRSCG